MQAAKIADAFEKDFHYTVDEKQKSVLLTEEGYEAAEDLLQVADLYDPRTQWALYIINALKAKELQLKDVDVHRQGQGGRDRGRVHRPHDGRPPLERRPAPGGGGEGGAADSERDGDDRVA